jgi:tetratricopeptide (TPR) repeat protein
MYAGDFESAIREQQKVLELNSSFALAYVGKALSELSQGKNEDATHTYQQLEKLGVGGASAAATGMADLALYEGTAKQTAGILEKAIAADLANKNNDGAANKLTTLAIAYLLSGKKVQALAATDKALGASKEDSVLFWSARTYLALDRDAKALALAQQLATRLENDPQAYAKLIQGEALLKRSKAAEALKLFQEARKTSDTWLGRLD